MLAFTDRAAIYPFHLADAGFWLRNVRCWLAPLTIRRLLTKRFLRLQQHAAVWSLISATAMLAVQGGLMGTGWTDVFSPNIWQAVLQTQFGGVWLWQIVLALVTLIVALMQPRNMPRLLFMLTTAQFILLAGVGHATLNEGVTAKIHQTNHAIHLICAAAWFGDYCRCSGVCNSSKAVGDTRAIQALMRFLVRAFCGDRRTGKRRA